MKFQENLAEADALIDTLEKSFEKLEEKGYFDLAQTFLLIYVARLFEWDKWRETIPYLTFPSHWKIRMVPPFINGIVRFFVRTDKMFPEERISIYLDCYDTAGFFGSPYWEVYPDVDGNNYRCGIDETDDLLKAIDKAIKKQEEDYLNGS